MMLLGGCAEPPSMLEDLARGADTSARARVRRDVCQCTCGSIVCWDFTCSGSGCSTADEHEIVIEDGLSGDCDPDAEEPTARLVAGDAAPIEAEVSGSCHQLTLDWRGIPAAVDLSAPHRIEIADHRTSWTIDDPFTPRTLAITAPAGAAGVPPGETLTVRAGDVVRLAVSPMDGVATPRAHLSENVGAPSTVMLAVTLEAHALAIEIPTGTAPGTYELGVTAPRDLPAEDCQGPAACSGLDAGATWDVRVDPGT